MDRLVTVFGGGGFLGRYVARELARMGARVRIAERHPKRAYFLKTQGALGQTQFVAADITRPDSLAPALRGTSSVVNLIGIMAGDFQAVHVAGAEALAKAAGAAGADAFVQVSAIGADPQSPSAYGRSKGEGEAAVRRAFPGATILRPSVVFGREDQFLNRFAQMARFMPVLPVLRGGTRFQPVFVVDVARAIARAAMDPGQFAGRDFELGGPEVLTMEQINRFAAEAGGHPRRQWAVPDGIGSMLASLPGGPLSRDQWQMLGRDNVVADGAEGLAALGVSPTPMAAVAGTWMVQYRKQGRFAAKRTA